MSATTLLLMLLFSVVTCEERELVVVDSKKIAIGASIPQYSWGHDEENDVRSTFSLRNLQGSSGAPMISTTDYPTWSPTLTPPTL